MCTTVRMYVYSNDMNDKIHLSAGDMNVSRRRHWLTNHLFAISFRPLTVNVRLCVSRLYCTRTSKVNSV